MKAGRPLRLLATLLGLWVCARGATLLVPAWLGSDVPEESKVAFGVKNMRAISNRSAGGEVETEIAQVQPPERYHSGARAIPAGAADVGPLPDLSGEVLEVAHRDDGHLERRPAESRAVAPPAVAPLSAQPEPAAPRTSRWSQQTWLLWRPDAESGRALAPLLGGSQMGARLDYRLVEGGAGALGLYVRASRALDGPSAEEVAVGVSVRPTALPFSLMVERREKLGSGARSGFAAMVAGGLNPVEVAPRVEAEAYVQAGIVALPGHDGFADGKASLAYRMTPKTRRPALMLGGAVSASAQPGARRIDVGPELRLYAPVGSGGVRLSAEWRARIAGNARPAGGPSVTLMTDF